MMHRMFGIGLCLFSSISLASFQSGADAIIQKLDPKAYLGAQVVDLTTGAALYQRNATAAFMPASNMKLFSDAAALMVLGPDYRFINQLSTTGKLRNGVLEGSLYLSLSGDPSFDHERLAHLLHELKKWHVTRIHGNVVIDSTHASIPPTAPGGVAKDLAYGYGAPAGPVMLDTNRLEVVINPGERVGSPALIEVRDPSGTVQLSNQVTTKASPQGCGVGLALDHNQHLVARGCMGKGQWALEQELAIRNPLLYMQGTIQKTLSRMHITLDGTIKLGPAPTGAFLLAKDRSKPIAQLLADTLKPSDNLYADSLFLHAAAVLHGSPLAWTEAGPVVRTFLQEQTGIDLSHAVMVDGSGLSRADRLTPYQTTALLQFLYYKFPLSYEYISALPISGRDGTLERRLKKPTQQDFVRAKTGTMAGVNSLAGYLYTTNGHTLAFTVFSNRKPKVNPRVSARFLIDTLCNYFLAQEPGNISWAKFFSAHKRLSYQQHLTQAQLQRFYQSRWRRLESALKLGLKNQPVGVVYRGNELVLHDTQADPHQVYNVLQSIAKKYNFAVAVSGREDLQLSKPVVLATDPTAQHVVGRVWTVRSAL